MADPRDPMPPRLPPEPAGAPLTTAPSVDQAVTAMRLLGDGHRLTLLRRLRQREACVTDLTRALAVSQPLTTYHVRSLREHGLVHARRSAQRVFYSLDADGWARFTEPIRGVLEAITSAHTRVDRQEE